MSFEKMDPAHNPLDDERLEQKVDSLLRSTAESVQNVTPSQRSDGLKTEDLGMSSNDTTLNQPGIIFFPKSPQQYPSVPEFVPSERSASIYPPHSIRAKKLKEAMSDWRKNHPEKDSVRNEKQPNTVYARITGNQSLEWYTLQNDAENVRLALSYSDDPESDSREQIFSGSHAEEHFEKFCSKTGLMYVDISVDPQKIPPEIRGEVGRKLQELLSKRAVLDGLLRQNAKKTEGHLLDTVARWFGRERLTPLKEQKSMENMSDIAKASEAVEVARRALAEQCQQVNEQGRQTGRVIITPSRTKAFVVNSSQSSQTLPSPISLVEEPQMNAEKRISEQPKKNESKDWRSALAGLLAEVATTWEEISLLREKKDSLLEELDLPLVMDGRIQKLREEAEGYFSGIDSLTLLDFLKKLAVARIQSRTSNIQKQSVSNEQQKSSEVLI